jgi:hypothetical protein
MSAPEPPLPPQATPDSRHRLSLAVMLTRGCPPALGQEIALTGSAARGMAYADSDLEINFWVDALPPADDRAEWLYSMGVRDYVLHFRPRADDSYWISGQFHGVSLEAGWQTFDALGGALTPILDGRVWDRKALTLAEIVASAVPLRTTGWLAAWQQACGQYPPELCKRLLDDLRKLATNDERHAGMLRLAARGEILALLGYLEEDATAVMRALFALNGRWEASPKWLFTMAATLPLMPDDWRAALFDILSGCNEHSVQRSRALMMQVLDMAGA